jgi:DNA-binding PadR family transcriptional regulator
MGRDRKCSRQTSMLLAALMERPRIWRHGYELSKDTRLKSGTLYPILMRLTDRNLLASKWQPAEQAGRPPRHMYRLTALGVAYARGQLTAGAAASWSVTPQRGLA